MAAVSIRTGFTSVTPAAEVPRESWAELLFYRRRLCEDVLPRDCRSLLFFIEDGRASGDYMGFGSEERYLREGLGIEDPETAQWAVRGLQLLGHDVPVTMAEAARIGRHGGDRKSQEFKDQGNNVTLIHRGNAARYRMARLERDRSDLAMRVKAGELSVNAACIEAGWAEKTWTAPADPDRLALAIAKRYPGYMLVKVNA